MIHVHNDTLTSRRAELQWTAALAVLAGVSLVVAALAPRSTPFMLLLLGGSVVASARFTDRAVVWCPLPALVWALTAMCAYLAVNSWWSVSPAFGLERVILLALTVTMALAVARILPVLPPKVAEGFSTALILGVGLMAIFLAFETPLGQPIRRFVVSFVPLLRPPQRHIQVEDGWVVGINLYTLNRNLALLNIILWPALLMLRARLPCRKALLVGCVLVAATAVASFASEHETSMLALVIGCFVLAGMTIAPKVSRAIVVAAWLAATMLVVPAADLAHDVGLHRASWIPQTARNRLVLWNVTADRLSRAPILGIGIGSTKPLDEGAAATAPVEQGDTYGQRTGRHAHNIFMQTWYELGATGAVLLLIIGCVALRAMARLPSADQPFAFASFASTMVIAAFTWGIWQPWFMCAFGLWAVLLLIAFDVTRRASEPKPSISTVAAE